MMASIVIDPNAKIVSIEDDGIIDDCIVASLGREEYMAELRKTGSLFLTNGWIEYWDKIIETVDGKNMINTMLEMDSYKRVLYIKQENIVNKEKDAKILSDSLGLEYTCCNGKMELMRRSLDKMIKGC